MSYRLKRSSMMGLPPGIAQYSGKIKGNKIIIEILSYQYKNVIDDLKIEHVEIEDLITHLKAIPENGITWIDIQGIHDENVMSKIADFFDFHPILREDLLSPVQRPKFDIYEHHLAFFLRRIFDDEATKLIETDQIAIVLGKNYVLSFNELNDDKFSKVKTMIKDNLNLFTQHKNDFLAYILIDFIVDSYFLEAERIDERIEDLEDLILNHEFDNLNDMINKLKKRNLGLRKIIYPLREVPTKLKRLDSALIADSTNPFLNDLEDNIYLLLDMVEDNRDLIPNLKESYASELSNRMNEIMMVLTTVSTIILPLSFITGFYGMNFRYMPELDWKYGYFATIGFMISIATGLFIFFKRRKWL